jgi:carboxymethylenebutenolidase
LLRGPPMLLPDRDSHAILLNLAADCADQRTQSMGEFTPLMARDGHKLEAYLAAPPAKTRGGIVVIQEIFGVNRHIRAVTDGFAQAGYTAIAPALFDRVRRGIELGYSSAEVEEGRGYAQQLNPEQTLKDLAAAVAVVKHAGRVATVGYCFGGAQSYRAACLLPIDCAVVYYGRVQDAGTPPRCPVLYHFGSADQSIPPEEVERIEALHPGGTFYVYEGAGHGFNCDLRASYDSAAAELARKRTLQFLEQHLQGNDHDGPVADAGARRE